MTHKVSQSLKTQLAGQWPLINAMFVASVDAPKDWTLESLTTAMDEVVNSSELRQVIFRLIESFDGLDPQDMSLMWDTVPGKAKGDELTTLRIDFRLMTDDTSAYLFSLYFAEDVVEFMAPGLALNTSDPARTHIFDEIPAHDEVDLVDDLRIFAARIFAQSLPDTQETLQTYINGTFSKLSFDVTGQEKFYRYLADAVDKWMAVLGQDTGIKDRLNQAVQANPNELLGMDMVMAFAPLVINSTGFILPAFEGHDLLEELDEDEDGYAAGHESRSYYQGMEVFLPRLGKVTLSLGVGSDTKQAWFSITVDDEEQFAFSFPQDAKAKIDLSSLQGTLNPPTLKALADTLNAFSEVVDVRGGRAALKQGIATIDSGQAHGLTLLK